MVQTSILRPGWGERLPQIQVLLVAWHAGDLLLLGFMAVANQGNTPTVTTAHTSISPLLLLLLNVALATKVKWPHITILPHMRDPSSFLLPSLPNCMAHFLPTEVNRCVRDGNSSTHLLRDLILWHHLKASENTGTFHLMLPPLIPYSIDQSK